MIRYFSGIDLQKSRGCSYYIMDGNKNYVTSGWMKDNIPRSFKGLFSKISNDNPDELAIGIDAPRMPIQKLRARYFDRTKNIWIEKPKTSNGRECEVILKSFNHANPQWTSTFSESPAWMKLGFEFYRWYMELFIDAYDWVMVPNVYGMSQFADGGLLAIKPYISGSNYLMKMSNYKKGEWQVVWDGLFWRFMHTHRDFFTQNPRLGMLVRSIDKMPDIKQNEHINNANHYLDSL